MKLNRFAMRGSTALETEAGRHDGRLEILLSRLGNHVEIILSMPFGDRVAVRSE